MGMFVYCTRFTNKIINEKRRYPKREEEAKRTAGLKREETGATLLHDGELKFFVAEGGLELLVIDISYHNPIIKKKQDERKKIVLVASREALAQTRLNFTSMRPVSRGDTRTMILNINVR